MRVVFAGSGPLLSREVEDEEVEEVNHQEEDEENERVVEVDHQVEDKAAGDEVVEDEVVEEKVVEWVGC